MFRTKQLCAVIWIYSIHELVLDTEKLSSLAFLFVQSLNQLWQMVSFLFQTWLILPGVYQSNLPTWQIAS